MEFQTMPMGSFARPPTVLIVLHQDHSTPGRVGVALKAMGARLDIRRPSCGEPLPEKLADQDGVVVFGGPMGANDSLDWVRRALGARVFRYDDKRSEIGYYAIEPNAGWRAAVLGSVPAHRLRMAYRRLRPARGRRTPGHGWAEVPQPSVSLWPAYGRPAIPP